jgi:hypothetical protein
MFQTLFHSATVTKPYFEYNPIQVTDTIFLSQIFHHQTFRGGFRNTNPLTVYFSRGDSVVIRPQSKLIKSDYNTVFTTIGIILPKQDSIAVRLKYVHQYTKYSTRITDVIDTLVFLHTSHESIPHYYPRAQRVKVRGTGTRDNIFEILKVSDDKALERRVNKQLPRRIDSWIKLE